MTIETHPIGERLKRLKRLEDAGNALAETIKMSKAALTRALTKREMSILMADLHAWNTAALSTLRKDEDNEHER